MLQGIVATILDALNTTQKLFAYIKHVSRTFSALYRPSSDDSKSTAKTTLLN